MSYKVCRLSQEPGASRTIGNVKVADTFLSRAVGLLRQKGLESDEFLLITHCSSVHTFFMRFSIDVLFLSSSGEVLKIRENVSPFRFVACRSAKATLETGAYAATRLGIKVGDNIKIGEIYE